MIKTLLWLDDYRNPYDKQIDWMAFHQSEEMLKSYGSRLLRNS